MNACASISLTTCAFLEIAQPSVQTAIDELVASGATEIRIFPHFLAAGTHVAQDIPRHMEEASLRHPNLTFTLLPHLGALPGLADLILNRI